MSGRRVIALLAVMLFVMSSLNTSLSVGEEDALFIQTAEDQETKDGQGFLRVGVIKPPVTINPLTAQGYWDWYVITLLLDSPVNNLMDSSKAIPWMAESWEYDPAEPLIGRMTLRQGIFWSDHGFFTYGEDDH